VNVNRRGELWVNTKEKSRPVFKTVQATRVEPEEGAADEAAPSREERKPKNNRREKAEQEPATPPEPLPTGAALLDKIRPLMRKNRRESGGSGSMSFLSRALRCTEAALIEAFVATGISPLGEADAPPVHADIGDETWWLSKDSRGGVWINAREKGAGDAAAAQHPAEAAVAAPGNVFAAVRLLMKETKTGAVAATVERLASELNRPADELLEALTTSGLKIPEKSREKPVFAEHAGEIFWLNLNGKGELWLNAKASKFSSAEGGEAGKGRRPRPKKKSAGDELPPEPAAQD
jgi:hypothetical protein